MASTELDHNDDIDTGWTHEPAQAPSARFGWHGVATKSFYIAGWFCVLALLGMLVGNHVGHVEDIWLVATAAGLAAILVKGMVAKTKWS